VLLGVAKKRQWGIKWLGTFSARTVDTRTAYYLLLILLSDS